MRKNGKVVSCANCGKSVYKAKYILEKNKNIFCSQKCHYEFQRNTIAYKIVDNYIEFKLYDKYKKEYICYIDATDIGLLDKGLFILFNKKDTAFWIANNKRQKLHRIILNCPKDKIIDHINHNTLDNRRCNLRICTRAENNQNKKGANKNSSTGLRNVYYKKQNNKYFVKVCCGGINYFSGYYPKTDEGLQTAISKAEELRFKHLPFSQ